MPRRGTELVQLPEPPKKKNKVVLEETPSLDVSVCDDEALTPGIIFTDLRLRQWRIGKPIGRGSFGRIYLASDEIDKEVTKSNARYVVKIEPHSNGPLFVEIHCLFKTALTSKVRQWRLHKKQKHLGMPVFIASGSFTDKKTGIKYRFLVLPRYDIDLEKIIARTKFLDLKNVLVIAIQILNVLEYLHNQGYTHSDIKSSNLMLGFDGKKLNKVSLIKIPSFEKETKQVAVLAGRYRRAKSGKSRSSNYYDDEDFIVRDYKTLQCAEEDHNDEKLTSVKNNIRKILSDRDSRTLHRYHAFNLRQLSHYVNYEDMTVSSVCSDQSYQKLLDDFGSKFQNEVMEDKWKNDNNNKNIIAELDTITKETHKEAVLSQSNGQIYLLDYGLASKFLDSDGNHKDFGMDARKAHDGTLQYSSRDSHIGAHSRRSDLETLGYNLLDWLTGTLPWKTSEVLAEPDIVHALKKNFMSDIKSLLKTCFKTELYPQFIEKYFLYVISLDFTDKPDYDYCRSLFKSELLKIGCSKDEPLNFDSTMSLINPRKLPYPNRFGREFIARNGLKKAFERENLCSIENDLKLVLLKQTLNSSSDGVRKPCTSRNFFISDADLIARLKKSLMPHDVLGKKLSPKNLRSKKSLIQKKRCRRGHRNSIGKFGNFLGSAKQFTWAEILAGNPEDIIRKDRTATTSDKDDDDNGCKYRIRKLSTASSEASDCSVQSPLLQKDFLDGLNPTYAMKEIIANLKKKSTRKVSREADDNLSELKGYTPIMIKYHSLKNNLNTKENHKNQNNVKGTTTTGKDEIQPRRTRSIKRKAVKESNPTTPQRVTKKKTTSVDSYDEVKKTVLIVCDNITNLEQAASKNNCRLKTRCVQTVLDLKNVKSSKVIEKNTRLSPRKKTLAVVPNRRKLRSSNRKKN